MDHQEAESLNASEVLKSISKSTVVKLDDLGPKDYAPLPQDKDASTSKKTPTRATPAASWLWIYTLCICNFGIGGSWALEFAIVTPYFQKTLSAGPVLSHAVWIVGPVSGLIIAPIVGSLSDRCVSRYGRRRPFIVAGMLATVFGMLTFSNATQLASFFFAPGSPNHHGAAIVVAVIAFCILDLAINLTMWPVRALQGDLVADYQQQAVQSAGTVLASFGDLAVNGLLHFFDQPIAHTRLIFALAAIFYTCTVSVLLVVGRETPFSKDDPAIANAPPPSFNIFAYLRGLPSWMWRIGGTYCLGFFALFCTIPNASSWLGSSVLGGDADAAKGSHKAALYEKGVNLYGQAGLVRAVLQILFSAIYPTLLDCGLQPGKLLSVAFAVFSVAVFIFANTNVPAIAEFVVIMMAFPSAGLFSIPVGMTVELSDESNRGRYLGALNCFAVIPQLIDTAYTGFVSRAFGEATVMRIGALWGFVAALGAWFLMRVD